MKDLAGGLPNKEEWVNGRNRAYFMIRSLFLFAPLEPLVLALHKNTIVGNEASFTHLASVHVDAHDD